MVPKRYAQFEMGLQQKASGEGLCWPGASKAKGSWQCPSKQAAFPEKILIPNSYNEFIHNQDLSNHIIGQGENSNFRSSWVTGISLQVYKRPNLSCKTGILASHNYSFMH